MTPMPINDRPLIKHFFLKGLSAAKCMLKDVDIIKKYIFKTTATLIAAYIIGDNTNFQN